MRREVKEGSGRKFGARTASVLMIYMYIVFIVTCDPLNGQITREKGSRWKQRTDERGSRSAG